jgi:hypothetical protein
VILETQRVRDVAEFLAPLVAVGAITGVLLVVQDGPQEERGDAPTITPAAEEAPTTTEPSIVDEIRLEAAPGAPQGADGMAAIGELPGGALTLYVIGTVQGTGRDEGYEVWLYNSRHDAQSMGAQLAGADGTFQGQGPLPPSYKRFQYIDVSREPLDTNAEHSGRSILRGRIP